MSFEYVAYAVDFVSYVLQHLPPEDVRAVRDVILFGSTVRGEARPESNVDLFVDTASPGRIEPKLKRLAGEFETSVKVTRYWRLLGVRPVISIKVGDVTEWESLQPALWKDGRVLFGPYRGTRPSLGQPLALVSWKDVASLSARTNVYRGLYGYRARGERYSGLIDKYHGQRVSKGSILVPVSALETFKGLFRRQKVAVRVRVLYELGA